MNTNTAFQLPFSGYMIDEEIGSGASALIYSIREKRTGQLYCCKILPKNRNDAISSNAKQISREVDSLKKLLHPNIPKFVDFKEDSENFYLIEEFCEGITLLDYINNHCLSLNTIPEIKAQLILREILKTLEYMHSCNISHRDLKAENIIINEFGPDLDNFTIKLVDFGFASDDKQNNQLLNTFCGSAQYASPEVIRHQQYDGSKADIWSAGVLFYALLTNRFPFTGLNYMALAENIIYCRYDPPTNVSKEAIKFLSLLLDVNPGTRISASKALEHSYMEVKEELFKTRKSLPSLYLLKNHEKWNNRRRMSIDISKASPKTFRSGSGTNNPTSPKVTERSRIPGVTSLYSKRKILDESDLKKIQDDKTETKVELNSNDNKIIKSIMIPTTNSYKVFSRSTSRKRYISRRASVSIGEPTLQTFMNAKSSSED